MNQHIDLPFEYVDPTDYQWTKKAYRQCKDGLSSASVRVVGGVRSGAFSGPCPRCLGTFSWTRVLDAVSGTGGVLGGSAPSDDRYEWLDIRCDCGHPHPGAPVGIHHCGISFRLEVLRSTDA